MLCFGTGVNVAFPTGTTDHQEGLQEATKEGNLTTNQQKHTERLADRDPEGPKQQQHEQPANNSQPDQQDQHGSRDHPGNEISGNFNRQIQKHAHPGRRAPGAPQPDGRTTRILNHTSTITQGPSTALGFGGMSTDSIIIIEAGRDNTTTVLLNGKLLDPRASQQVMNHSPDGFNWGYSGSGPAQLALAILLEVTGDRSIALRNYQEFKRDHVATWPADYVNTTIDITAYTK